jgi:hypothetical protein
MDAHKLTIAKRLAWIGVVLNLVALIASIRKATALNFVEIEKPES